MPESRLVDGSVASRVAAELRQAIMRGELSPGEQIRQAEWARQLHVSPVPVREALKSLSAEGLLSNDHNRGYFVVRFGPAEASEIYVMRRLIETELLRTVEWPSREVLARLRTIGREASAAIVDLHRDLQRWNDLDHRFLQEVYGLSPRQLIQAEAERLWQLSNVYRGLYTFAHLDRTRQGARFYENVVNALEARDRVKLIKLFTDLRRDSEKFYTSILEQRGETVRAAGAGSDSRASRRTSA